jgi:superoxide dismutase, Fe-Mn family
MNVFVNKKVKDIIKESLGTKKDLISESLVAQKKNFSVTTDYLSKESLGNHKELYEGYAENFNKISAALDSVDRSNISSNNSNFRSLKLDETYNMNGVYLHELYFANIGDPNSRINMDTLSYMRLNRDFGSFDDWQKDFIACALSSRNGWAVTYLNLYTQTYMNCFLDMHSKDVPAGMVPVIVMDMWQHSYYKDYLKDAKTYLIAMMKEFKWSVIEKRFEKSDKIIQVMKGTL